jgi:protein-disulfide isomerase
MWYAFRHFPLSRVHPHALRAALAGEAAGAQGQFWKMHDTLFTHQDALDDGDLVGYAQDLGLDVRRFISDMRSGRHLPKVRSDCRSGVGSGVNGTPAFFIDERRFDGNWADGSLMATVRSLVESRAARSAAGRIETPHY